MKTNLLTIMACAGLLTGCAATSQNRPLTVLMVRQAVNLGTMYGIEQDPTIVPYLRAATPVICNAAGKGMLDPVDIVADLQATDVDMLKTPLGIAVVNSALAIYEGIYTYYGTNVQASVIEPYLEGVCEGLRMSFPAVATQANIANPPLPKLPPHLHVR